MDVHGFCRHWGSDGGGSVGVVCTYPDRFPFSGRIGRFHSCRRQFPRRIRRSPGRPYAPSTPVGFRTVNRRSFEPGNGIPDFQWTSSNLAHIRSDLGQRAGSHVSDAGSPVPGRRHPIPRALGQWPGPDQRGDEPLHDYWAAVRGIQGCFRRTVPRARICSTRL